MNKRTLISLCLLSLFPFACSKKDDESPVANPNKNEVQPNSENGENGDDNSVDGNGTSDSKTQPSSPSSSYEKSRQLNIVKKPSGALAFGVLFSLASDPDGMSWFISFSTDISDSELNQLPAKIYWNLIYKTGEAPPIPLSQAINFVIDKNMLKIGQIKIDAKPAVGIAILTQKDGLLVFGDSPENAVNNPKYTIDIGFICKSSPEYFSNITNSKKCSEIKADDIQ